MDNSKSFLKGFFTLFSGNVIAQIIPFLFAPVLSRIFTNEDFAIQANFMAIIGLIAIVAGGRYELAVVLPKASKKAINLIVLAFTLTIGISALSLLAILCEDQIAKLYETDTLTDYLPYISIGVFLSSTIAILTNWLVRGRSYKAISTLKIIQSVAINLITLAFGFLNYGVSGLIFGWLIGLAITVVFLYFSVRNKIAFTNVSKDSIKEVAKEYKDFPLINSLHAFTDIFFSQFILFTIITKEFGLMYLGLFFMMNKYLKAPIRVIGSAVGQVYYKEANDRFLRKENVFLTLKHSVKLVSFFAIPVCLVILFFGPPIFKWYLGADWEMSGVYAQIMATPILFNFLVSPISATVLIYKKQKTAFLISLIGYLLAIIALEYGVQSGWSFENSLKLFAAVMTIYYIYLLLWYSYLTKYK